MKPNQKMFWNWKNQTEGETDARDLELYGTIAEESWFDDDVTPGQFKEELFSGSGDVTVKINSPGGDCVAASMMYSMLRDYEAKGKGKITVKVEGIAASAASVVAMAGTEVLMEPTALMMIHNPATLAFGDHSDMQKAIEMLDEVKESIINAYETKTHLSRAKLSHLMDEETWMNANKAVELGFADRLASEESGAEIPAYAFSGRAVETALVNKITSKTRTATPKPAQVEPETHHGRSVDDLMERLNLIKF